MSPQNAPLRLPFARTDRVCDRLISGELHRHSCAAHQLVRVTSNAADAIRHRLGAEHPGRVDVDEPAPSRPRQQPLGCGRCARARSGAWRHILAMHSVCSCTRAIRPIRTSHCACAAIRLQVDGSGTGCRRARPVSQSGPGGGCGAARPPTDGRVTAVRPAARIGRE